MQLDGVVPWGRSFEEYARMFALSGRELGGRILRCADGPASFNAEAHARGVREAAVEPVPYEFQRGAREMLRIVGEEARRT